MKQADPRPIEIRQLPRVLLSSYAVSRSSRLRRYHDQSHCPYSRHLLGLNFLFAADIFWRLVQIFERPNRETTRGVVDHSDGAILSRNKGNITGIEEGK